MTHRILLLLHLVGTVAFFSNVVAALFWQRRADQSREPAVVAYAFRTLNAGDLWITPISVVLILASGVGLAILRGLPLLATGWILWSTAAFLASGFVFVLGVLPLQRRIARWTSDASSAAGVSEFDWERYERESRRWTTPAHVSLGLALLAMILMVAKPGLPAFRGDAGRQELARADAARCAIDPTTVCDPSDAQLSGGTGERAAAAPPPRQPLARQRVDGTVRKPRATGTKAALEEVERLPTRRARCPTTDSLRPPRSAV